MRSSHKKVAKRKEEGLVNEVLCKSEALTYLHTEREEYKTLYNILVVVRNHQ